MPPYQIPIEDIQFTVYYSDNSLTDIIGGGIWAPGQWNASWLQNPISDYEYQNIGQYTNMPIASLFLGPDDNGYVLGTLAMGIVYDPTPGVRPKLCQPSLI